MSSLFPAAGKSSSEVMFHERGGRGGDTKWREELESDICFVQSCK